MTHEKIRRPFVAGFLSFLSVGLGFVYNGAITKGVIVSAAYLALDLLIGTSGAYKSLPFALLASAILTLIWIYFIVYSSSQARRIGTIPLKACNHWYVYVLYVLVSLSPYFLVDTTSGVDSYKMPTGSMLPNFEENEHVAVDKTYYQHHELKHGDVVVFRYPKNHQVLMLKRCIATAGEMIQIRDGLAYVNGERSLPTLLLRRVSSKLRPPDYRDSRIVPENAGNADQYGPLVVPDRKVFLLGDCRDNSLDSRFFGFVDRDEIVGKVLYIWWSADFSRIGGTTQ